MLGHHASMRVARVAPVGAQSPSDDEQSIGVDCGSGYDGKHARIEPKGEAVSAQERRPQNWLFYNARPPVPQHQ